MRNTPPINTIPAAYSRLSTRLINAALCLNMALGLTACGTVPGPAAPTQAGVMKQAGEYSQGVFYGKDKVELFEQSWQQTNSKAVIVIVHGLKDHSSRYAWTVPHFLQHGYDVYAFDLRGHAHSKGERVYVESFTDYVTDLELFLARVKRAEPGKPVFLLGHSMGAAIVTRYVQTHPGGVQGVALSAGALKVGEPAIVVGSSRLLAKLAPRAPLFQLDLDDFSRDPQVVAASKADPLVAQGGAPVHTAVQIIDAIAALQAQAPDIMLPVFFMHGTADTITPPEGSQALYARIPSPQKSMKLYEGLAHDLLHEPEKEQVLSDLINWMDTTLHYVNAAQKPVTAERQTRPANKS